MGNQVFDITTNTRKHVHADELDEEYKRYTTVVSHSLLTNLAPALPSARTIPRFGVNDKLVNVFAAIGRYRNAQLESEGRGETARRGAEKVT